MTVIDLSNRSAIDPQVATTPSAPEQLIPLQEAIEIHSQAYRNGNADARLKLLETARSLVQAMETPQETHATILLGPGTQEQGS